MTEKLMKRHLPTNSQALGTDHHELYCTEQDALI
jgi:hypothetical protein